MKRSIANQGRRFKREMVLGSVDVGKDKNFGYFRSLCGPESKPFGFCNSREGFEEFLRRMMGFLKECRLKDIVIGLESTGVYGEPLIHFLLAHDLEVVLVNPKHTKRLKELQGNSPNKTDKKDPKVIADIMELGHYLSVVIPVGPAADLRNLSEARERSIAQRTRLYNQLHSLVFSIFPEFVRVMKGNKSKSSLHLLRHMPLPEQVVSAGVEELCLELKRVSRGRHGLPRAQALFQAAYSSVGVKEGQTSIVYEIGLLLGQLAALENTIVEIEERMGHLVSQIPWSRFLLSMKGIGVVTVAGLIGEFGDLHNFSKLEEILKFGGLNLYELSSGNHQGQRRISKRGRAMVRKLLYFAALNTVRKGGIMHDVYQRHLAKGMKKNKALIAVSRKLLSVMFALVRRNEMYDLEYNRFYPLKEAA